MSENTSEITATTAGETNEQNPEAKEFHAITSQEDFDKAIQARIARERAKLPTDYDDLKAKAAKFEQWENDQKTEAQKLQDERDQAQSELAAERAARIRAEVAASKGVPAELLSGSTQADLEAAADALIAFRGEQAKPSAAPFIENTNKTDTAPNFDAAIEAAKESRNFALVATLRQQKAAQSKG